MVTRTLLVLALMFAPFSARADFVTGQSLHEWLVEADAPHASATREQLWTSGLAYGYVESVTDGPARGKKFCPTNGITGGQMVAVVAKYLTAHPERWNYNANSLVIDSLREAFPCK